MGISQLAHVAAFGLAALGCLLATWRVRYVSHRETRYGLYGLLALSAVWALGELALFLSFPVAVGEASYQVGLVAGLATVGAWLYFCSAYSGQRYHRQPVFRRAAVAVFLSISTVKLTNPIHGLYFTAEQVTTPFPHTAIRLLELHYVVTLLSYSLTAVGFYMLFQLFTESDIRTTGLTALVSLTALPVVLDLLGFLAVPQLVATNYEPLGVAAFALGTLYLAEDTFESVRWTAHRQVIDRIDEGIVVVDGDGIVRDCNAAARRLFPALETNVPFEVATAGTEVQPGGDLDAVSAWDDRSDIIRIDGDGEGAAQYYVVNETDLTVGPHSVGRALVVTDVTQVERQRRQLKRHSEQLDGFAAAVAHELRNTLTIADANLTLVGDALDRGQVADAETTLRKVVDANERMTDVVADLTTLARLSKSVTDPPAVQFAPAVRQAFAAADAGAVGLVVSGDGQLRADETRVSEIVRNAARLAVETGASELAVTLGSEGIELLLRGEKMAVEGTDGLFEYGSAVPTSEAGMCGPNIQTLARAHGWEVSASPLGPGGVRILITGVTVERSDGDCPDDRVTD